MHTSPADRGAVLCGQCPTRTLDHQVITVDRERRATILSEARALTSHLSCASRPRFRGRQIMRECRSLAVVRAFLRDRHLTVYVGLCDLMIRTVSLW
jgi:hypothetical protein